jgi:hypothetical protein
MNEELKKLISEFRTRKILEYEAFEESDSFKHGYWHGYFGALNDLLDELNKIPMVNCAYKGMGFD